MTCFPGVTRAKRKAGDYTSRSPTQVAILRVLHEHVGTRALSLRGMEARLGLSKPVISNALLRLQAKGTVVRVGYARYALVSKS